MHEQFQQLSAHFLHSLEVDTHNCSVRAIIRHVATTAVCFPCSGHLPHLDDPVTRLTVAGMCKAVSLSSNMHIVPACMHTDNHRTDIDSCSNHLPASCYWLKT